MAVGGRTHTQELDMLQLAAQAGAAAAVQAIETNSKSLRAAEMGELRANIKVDLGIGLSNLREEMRNDLNDFAKEVRTQLDVGNSQFATMDQRLKNLEKVKGTEPYRPAKIGAETALHQALESHKDKSLIRISPKVWNAIFLALVTGLAGAGGAWVWTAWIQPASVVPAPTAEPSPKPPLSGSPVTKASPAPVASSVPGGP